MGIIEDALNRLHELGDELGIKDDERDDFVKEGMTRKGFTMKETIEWVEPEPEGGAKKTVPMFGRSSQSGGSGGSGGSGKRAAGQYRE